LVGIVAIAVVAAGAWHGTIGHRDELASICRETRIDSTEVFIVALNSCVQTTIVWIAGVCGALIVVITTGDRVRAGAIERIAEVIGALVAVAAGYERVCAGTCVNVACVYRTGVRVITGVCELTRSGQRITLSGSTWVVIVA